MKIVIVGGVAGGATAAARLRRIDDKSEIILFEKGEHVSFANCGLPYYIGGEILNKESILVQTPKGLKERFNIDVRIKSEVISIDTNRKSIKVNDYSTNTKYTESYDKLLISTGAKPIIPPIANVEDSDFVFTLRNLTDAEKIKKYIDDTKPTNAVVIGSGFIGIEMVENLKKLGIKVTVIEFANQVMNQLDFEMSSIVKNHLLENDIDIFLESKVTDIDLKNKAVILENKKSFKADIIILGTGVRPDTKLAKESGIELGSTGGIKVNDYLETSAKDVYAVGDAIEITNFVSNEKGLIPLAWPANRQARIVADNIYGASKKYKGTVGTSILRIFGLAVAKTGLSEKDAQKLKLKYKVIHTHPGSHAGYYPGASTMALKIIFNESGKILGAQCIGFDGVDKRIDIISTAIQTGVSVYDLADLELAYAPQFSSAKDPINMLGYIAEDILSSDVKTFQWNEVGDIQKTDAIILDVREEGELVLGKIENSVNIPMSQIRERYSELNKSKKIFVYCQVGIRGYIASRFLSQNGFDAYNLDGGYKTYSMVFKPELKKVETEDSGETKKIFIKPLKMTEVKNVRHLDATGLQCPGPLQKLFEEIKKMQPGEVVEEVASDPAFHIDIQKWCERTGHKLLEKSEDNGKYYVRVEKANQEEPQNEIRHHENKLTMIVFDGDLDKAIAAFIIANGAATFGKEVVMFFTFWGLNIIRKNHPVKVKKNLIERMFGMMMPRGSKQLDLSKMNMLGFGPIMIRNIMKSKNVSSLEELMKQAQSHGVRLVACTMSMDVMGIKKEELIDGVELGGVASYLGEADTAGINMFV